MLECTQSLRDTVRFKLRIPDCRNTSSVLSTTPQLVPVNADEFNVV